TAVEHPAVRVAAQQVAAEGGVHLVIPVDAEAGLDLDALDAALAGGPALVSCMWVNNEVGISLPVAQVAQQARAAGSACHTDAVQAVGKVPVRLDEVPVDLLTVTGHKIYGPRGTGASSHPVQAICLLCTGGEARSGDSGRAPKTSRGLSVWQRP
ncbi:MAG: aminotransferase class V-fold PLP-dependent enzyme, partial [Gemmatimonadota bacterium]|nr:aminotransferase class V-fold PLP-dependent enzyme [Gemmatimonadota bacterium]